MCPKKRLKWLICEKFDKSAFEELFSMLKLGKPEVEEILNF